MDDPQIYAIPDPVGEEFGIAAVWHPRGKLGAFAFRGGPDKGKPTRLDANSIKVHQVQRSNLLFNPVSRKLLLDSCGTFLAAQKLSEKVDNTEKRGELLKLSHQYRSITRACLETLQDHESKLQSGPDKDSYLQLIKVFYAVEFVWHLCEILYVDVQPGDIILPQFMEWIRFHFFKCERRATEFMNADYGKSMLEERAETQPDYWDTIIELISQGRIDAARSLLRLHSKAHTEAFSLVDTLLHTMPVYSIYCGLSVVDFNVKWKSWQNDCITKLEEGIFSTDRNLELIVKLLAGDKPAFEVIKSKSETWYQYMAAVLLFTEPTVRTGDLSYIAKRCMDQFGMKDNMLSIDYILLSLMETDLEQAINLISQTTENGWFAAHLTNLLYLCGSLNVVDMQQIDVTTNLNEKLLLDYATLLMSHETLWTTGVIYFDHCPTEGQQYLSVLLSRIPVKTSYKAHKIIHVAEERGLNHIVVDVCKVMGMRSLEQQRLGSALAWAMKSQDSSFVTYLANQFLEKYNQDGQFQSLDFLEYLGPSMLLCDRLTFLRKYIEFHKLYRAGAFREAGHLIVSLLSSKIAPLSFWLTLLMDALPLVESSDIIFSSEETFELLSWLEKLIRTGNVPRKLSSNSNSKIQTDSKLKGQPEADSESIFTEKVNLIRLALSRNLARALCQENSKPEEESRDQLEADAASCLTGSSASVETATLMRA